MKSALAIACIEVATVCAVAYLVFRVIMRVVIAV